MPIMKPLQIQCTGYAIAVDWYDGADSSKVLLVLPGYTSSKSRQIDFVSALVEQTGTSALVIDYTGHGESPLELKDTRPAQHFLEVIYAFDWLRDNYPEAEISVTGSSYGGFLAVQLTKYREFKNLVLRAPAIYRPNEFYNLWGDRLQDEENYAKSTQEFRSNAEALEKHPLLGRASKYAGRTLVVVHEHDEHIPREVTNAYIKAFNAESFIAEGFVHSVGQSNITKQQVQDYQSRIALWLKQV